MSSNENIRSVVWILMVQHLNFQNVGDSDDYYDQDFLAVEIATSILQFFYIFVGWCPIFVYSTDLLPTKSAIMFRIF
jgi:hypothetical protein